MIDCLDKLMDNFEIEPVLFDIGASGGAPEIWTPIASHSTIVGFDPDERATTPAAYAPYKRGILVRKAVTAGADASVRFYLTKSPYCSSTLPPDETALRDWLFSDLFQVERQVEVAATTLPAVFDEFSIASVDWFKTDSQGTDLRLFNSLPAEVRSRVLAVDVEPGLIDAYRGEDLFVDTHRDLLRQGFWLSNLKLGEARRLRRDSLPYIAARAADMDEAFIKRTLRNSPIFAEARYLRSIPSLEDRGAPERDYTLLWVFALLDQQYGYAFDISRALDRRFDNADLVGTMSSAPLDSLREVDRRLYKEQWRWSRRIACRVEPFLRKFGL